jgi:hypothetical protein
MKRFLRHPHYFLILLGILVSMIVKADVWESPSVKTYYSENKEYKLVITPKMTTDKYYLWDYYKSNRHPQTKKILRKKEKFIQNISGQDTIQIPCTAELYRINGKDSVSIWKKSLLNNYCPVYAIVANDGSSIATFDNWYSTGYGVNVFVIYNEKGEAKRTYKLEEISPFPLNDYSMSISSLYWNKNVRFIDNERIEIVFETKNKELKKKVYNTKKLEFEE